MEWFRFYHEAVNDPKVQRLTPVLFKHWINVMCIASMNPERGVLPSWPDMAFTLRLPEAKVRTIVFDLERFGLVDREGETFRIHGWGKRQKRSDDVAARVTKHRYGNVSDHSDETLQETLHVGDSETLPHVRVTETETEQRQNRDRTELPPTSPPAAETTANGRKPPGQAKPWDVLETVCEVLGTSTSDLSEADKGKQLNAAKRLLAGGATLDEITRLTAFLQRQSWVTSGVDLVLIDQQIGKWRLNGRPDAPKPSLNGIRLPPHLQQRVDRWVIERQTLKLPIEPYPDALLADIEAWKASRLVGATL